MGVPRLDHGLISRLSSEVNEMSNHLQTLKYDLKLRAYSYETEVNWPEQKRPASGPLVWLHSLFRDLTRSGAMPGTTECTGNGHNPIQKGETA